MLGYEQKVILINLILYEFHGIWVFFLFKRPACDGHRYIFCCIRELSIYKRLVCRDHGVLIVVQQTYTGRSA